MLVDIPIEITIHKKNINFYLNLGYACNLKDKITIQTSELTLGSHTIVDVICDNCGKPKSIAYQKYIKNIKNMNFYACSSKCAQDKVKNTNIKNFGDESFARTNEYKIKLKKIIDEKYNGIHFTKTKEVIEKNKQTCLEKYGVDNVMFNKDIINKRNEYFLNKFGFINPFQNKDIKYKLSDIALYFK